MIRKLAPIPLLFLVVSIATAETKTVTIPLDQIWALDMPGTQDILALDLERLPQPLGSLMTGSVDFVPASQGEVAGQGFAVLGTGMDALIAAHKKLLEGQKPLDSFPYGREISVVFYSCGFGYYVHLHHVERHGNVIKIWYQFVPHDTKNLSSHFALIPAGRLAPGRYDVEVIRSPMDKQFVDAGFKPVTIEQAKRVVCKSFSFTVLPNQHQ